MTRLIAPLTLLLTLLLTAVCALATAEEGIRVPEGFEVTLYADDAIRHDIFSMTIDAQGRVVVAGQGYVKTLHDDDGDGRADRATLFSTVPASGAHGMYFDGADLVCTGDDAVMRLRDANGDGAADGEPERWARLRHPEHGANGIVRGPDGCYYLVCGNDAGVTSEVATHVNSPVQQPRAGAIVRFSQAGKPLDVYADGFRNPYDLDIDAAGHVITVDSDGERDHHLPWYAPMRMFDVVQGSGHGWLLAGWNRTWNRPESFFDSVERAATFGRGSPTGVAVYRHRAFPERYRGGVFAACWTFGRVYYVPLSPQGASVVGEPETFLETTGDAGFAPCDLAVGPAGDLFVAIGGRRTRGSVFRVTYKNRGTGTVTADPLATVLAADQPLSSWSRARWVPQARELGKQAFVDALTNGDFSTGERVRAVEVLVEVFGGLDMQTAALAAADSEPEVRARVAWALGRGLLPADALALVARLTGDEAPAVQRYAWETLALGQPFSAAGMIQPDWMRGLTSTDRRVRGAAIAVASGAGRTSYRSFVERARIAADAWPLRLAQLRVALDEGEVLIGERLDVCLDVLVSAEAETRWRLEAVRLLQLALGDLRVQEGQAEVYSGYVGNATAELDDVLRTQLAARLAPLFPSDDAELNRELARTLGMLAADAAPLGEALARKWTHQSTVEDDIHYLIVASLLPGERSGAFTAATAECLLGLHHKLAEAGHFASRNWPFRVSEAFGELCRNDGALASAVAESARLNHVEHTLFVEQLPSELQPAAALRLWSATVGEGGEATPGLIALVGKLPPETAIPLLRPLWEDGAVRDAVVLELAKHPEVVDREKFIAALASPQPAVVERAARALFVLGIDSTPAEMAAALWRWKQACALGKQMQPREILMRLLEFWTEDGADVDWDPDPARLWVGWYKVFADYYPAEASRLLAGSATDAESWKRRLDAIDWSIGEVARGRQVFELRSCHRCHQASGHLGPELSGAVKRMSRDDLFTAILDPNLEVSPAYLTTLVATTSGDVYHGLVVYESPEGTLLQTGPDTTVRIVNAETSSMRKSTQSLMPTGLLDPLSDQELSDLFAYLKSLAKD